MTLVDLMLGVTLGRSRAPDMLSLALFMGAKEVTDHGYRRADIKRGSWEIRDGEATGSFVFGPFSAPVSFDRVALLNGNSVLEEEPLASTTTLAARSVYTHVYGHVFPRSST